MISAILWRCLLIALCRTCDSAKEIQHISVVAEKGRHGPFLVRKIQDVLAACLCSPSLLFRSTPNIAMAGNGSGLPTPPAPEGWRGGCIIAFLTVNQQPACQRQVCRRPERPKGAERQPVVTGLCLPIIRPSN